MPESNATTPFKLKKPLVYQHKYIIGATHIVTTNLRETMQQHMGYELV